MASNSILKRLVVATVIAALGHGAEAASPRVTIIGKPDASVAIRSIGLEIRGNIASVHGIVRRMHGRFGHNAGCVRIEAFSHGQLVGSANARWWPFAHRHAATSRFSANLRVGETAISEVRAYAIERDCLS